MPSPFPGMDPFIESQTRRDFRLAFMVEMSYSLVASLRPRYAARLDEREYVEHLPRIQGPVTDREPFLTVCLTGTMEVVTVIDMLSPASKQRGSAGHREYVAMRDSILRSDKNLVELDLLRGGERPPTATPLPPTDCRVVVSRADRRPRLAEIWTWSLRQPMPAIPVPLCAGEPDVVLDLQAVFDTVYDRSHYGYALDYSLPVEPPLSDEDAAWVQEMLAQRDVRGAPP